MKKNIFYLSVLLFFTFIFTIFYIGLDKSNFYKPKEVKNKNLEEFTSTELFSNKQLSSKDIIENNNFTLINIWSSWCEPCKDESEYLLELKKNTPVMMIGINYKDNKKNALNFLKLYGNPFDQIFIDKQGTISINFGAYGVPETFLINEHNKLLKKYIGPLNDKDVYEIKKITNN